MPLQLNKELQFSSEVTTKVFALLSVRVAYLRELRASFNPVRVGGRQPENTN